MKPLWLQLVPLGLLPGVGVCGSILGLPIAGAAGDVNGKSSAEGRRIPRKIIQKFVRVYITVRLPSYPIAPIDLTSIPYRFDLDPLSKRLYRIKILSPLPDCYGLPP